MGAAVLHREAFTTSRLLEYFSEKELTLQTGHESERWPEVIIKEAIDNALDACEEAGILPAIVIEITRRSITISDNGPGIPASVIAKILDYSSRTSSRDFYIAPTRGSQGNAMKGVLAIPFVLSDGVKSDVTITTGGQEHRIRVEVDRLAQTPAIRHRVSRASSRKKGTRIEVQWPQGSACRISGDARFLQIVEGFSLWNPHARFILRNGKDETVFPRRVEVCTKWIPSAPTSAHWYTAEQLRNLLRAYIAHEQQGGRAKTIREFIAEFRGLSGTAKQKAILAALRVRGEHVRDLVARGDVDQRFADRLLSLLQQHSHPVKPAALGILGAPHFARALQPTADGQREVDYRKTAGVDEDTGRPFVIETAFLHRADGDGPRILTGINFSPCLVDPFRSLNEYGVSLDALLGRLHVQDDSPVTFALHLVSPHWRFTDRGKSSVEGL